jgi:hypothetical protein
MWKSMQSLSFRIAVATPENVLQARLVIEGALRKLCFKACFVDAFVYDTLYVALQLLSALANARRKLVFGSFVPIYGRFSHGS